MYPLLSACIDRYTHPILWGSNASTRDVLKRRTRHNHTGGAEAVTRRRAGQSPRLSWQMGAWCVVVPIQHHGLSTHAFHRQ